MSDINFVTTDSKEIYDTVMQALEDGVDEPLYPGDERTIFGEALADAWVALYSLFNDRAKQRFLRFARGTVLDAIGEREQTERLQADTAKTVIRFSVSAPQTSNIIIPAGTKVTPDSEVYFATIQTAVLQANASHVDVVAECMQGGAQYNGYSVGTITTLVDLVPYINGVTNTTPSSGGDDGEPYTEDGDDRYRERIRLARAKRSTAGPEDAYRYFAMSADPDIVDVRITNPEAGRIVIIPLMVGGELPDAETLAAVEAACNPDDVRPMCDYVSAQAPSTVEYDIELKYYTTLAEEADAITTIEGADGAIARYNEWQMAAIGRDINPDKLRSFILAPRWEDGLVGAIRLDVTSPTLTTVDETSVARWSGVLNISHEVVTE